LVSPTAHPQYKFSGISWKLVSEEEIPVGSEVEIIHTDVGILRIRAVKEA
jgi:membrane protein implicated in regulation of membrane protease activity